MFNEKALKKLNILHLLLIVVILLALGTAFYTWFEGFSPINALYFSATTLTGVGSIEHTPHTDFGKLFTIAYIFSGIGIILFFINAMVYKAQQRHPLQALFEKIKDEKAILLEHFHHTEDKKSN